MQLSSAKAAIFFSKGYVKFFAIISHILGSKMIDAPHRVGIGNNINPCFFASENIYIDSGQSHAGLFPQADPVRAFFYFSSISINAANLVES